MKEIAGDSKHQILASLREQHRQYEERLRVLADQRSLTSAEQIEYCQLKKKKLLTKDRIARLQFTA